MLSIGRELLQCSDHMALASGLACRSPPRKPRFWFSVRKPSVGPGPPRCPSWVCLHLLPWKHPLGFTACPLSSSRILGFAALASCLLGMGLSASLYTLTTFPALPPLTTANCCFSQSFLTQTSSVILNSVHNLSIYLCFFGAQPLNSSVISIYYCTVSFLCLWTSVFSLLWMPLPLLSVLFHTSLEGARKFL